MFGICGDGSNVFLPAQTMAGGKLFEKSFPNAFSERRPLFRNFLAVTAVPAPYVFNLHERVGRRQQAEHVCS